MILGKECSALSKAWLRYLIIAVKLTQFRDQVYFKSSQMREMDDHFGDLYGMISDREVEISHELAQYVLQYEALVITISDVCGELDRYGKVC